jgi:hypothetical protein
LPLCKYPKSWYENKTVGLEWRRGFMKQHSSASHRKAESTGLPRATSSNLRTFSEFYDTVLLNGM